MIEKQYFKDEATYQNGSGDPDESFTYVYDAFGREVSVTQQSVSETRAMVTSYDSQGQVIRVDSPEEIVNYEYDQYGRKTRTYTGDPNNPVTDTLYTYDALGRLATVSVVERNDELLATPETTTYQYDLVGNLDQTILPNGVITDYTYDELNRLETLTHYLADDTPEDLSDNDKIVFEYEVRADGKRTKDTETIYRDENENGQFEVSEIKMVTTDWTYDEAGRLIDEVFSHYDDLLDQSSHFTYDLTGNRLEQQIEKDFDGDGDIDKKTTTYSYDENDRLLSESMELDDNNDGSVDSTSTTTYSYTGTQQTGKTVSEGGVNQSTTSFTYDLQGRMETVTITTLDGTGAATRIEKTTYDYNATGIRVSALHEVDTDADGTVDETTKTEYLNDPYNFTGYSQVIQETEYDENGVITKRVIYTIGHDQISQTTIEYVNGTPQTPQTLYFLVDGHGSTRVLADATGAIASISGVEQLFFYDAYGNLLNMQATQAATSFLYSSEQFDAKIGQQYLRARYYDASTGRFNRLDPYTGNFQDPQSFHKYIYAHSDPVNWMDPTGKSISGLAGVGIAIGVVTVLAGVGAYLYYYHPDLFGQDIQKGISPQIYLVRPYYGTPKTKIGDGRYIAIYGESDNPDFEDYATEEQWRVGTDGVRRPLTQTLPDNSVSDFSIRSSPISAVTWKEISRLAKPGAVLTIAHHTEGVKRIYNKINSLEVYDSFESINRIIPLDIGVDAAAFSVYLTPGANYVGPADMRLP